MTKQIEIRLEELKSTDFSQIRPWIDPRIFRIFKAPVSDDQLSLLLTKHVDGKPVSLGYRIVQVSDTAVIGFIHAVIDWNNDLAHIGQIVIGDPALRSLGIGTEVLRQFLRICFEDLRLHRAQIFVDEDNMIAIACYQKAGFKVEGLMRDAVKIDSNYISWHSMSILRVEWRSNQLGR